MRESALYTFGNVLSALIVGAVLVNSGMIAEDMFRTITGAIVMFGSQVMLLVLSADARKRGE